MIHLNRMYPKYRGFLKTPMSQMYRLYLMQYLNFPRIHLFQMYHVYQMNPMFLTFRQNLMFLPTPE